MLTWPQAIGVCTVLLGMYAPYWLLWRRKRARSKEEDRRWLQNLRAQDEHKGRD